MKRKNLPWQRADSGKKIGINVPMPEPLMKKLDYLIEHKAIRSKSSFIRDTVEQAASDEIARLWRVQEAVRAYEKQGRRKR
jgi:metal-responsive CopG/Arc/MetJ family transcriptional regulator